MADKDQAGESGREVVELPPALLRQFAEMAAVIPEAEPDGGASLIEAIFNAGSEQELSSRFGTASEDEMLNREIIVNRIERMPSDYRDGLGIFLVIHFYDTKTQRPGTFTSGSMAVLAQLVRAYAEGWLPLHCKLMKAEKKTKAGFYPHHLHVFKEQPARAKA
jgi:hypothetical protein